MLKESHQTFHKNPDFLPRYQNIPVVLASASTLRLDSLKKIGFQNITAFPMPDVLEKKINQELINNKFLLQEYDDPYSTKIPEYVARAKLEYLISQSQISESALLVSLDTLAMAFRYNPYNSKDIRPMWTAHHFPKVDNLIDLQKILLSNFRQLVKADRKFTETLGGIEHTPEILELRKFAYLPRLIEVSTGIAIRLPNQKDISTTSVSSRLELQKVLDSQGIREELNQLIDKIFKITTESGSSPLKISGGIDYSNPKILRLLKVREVSLPYLPDSENGIYLGFPERHFLEFVSSLDNNVN
jgi:hypothetical protein